MATPCRSRDIPRKRLRLSISRDHTQTHTHAYIAQLPTHAHSETQNYLPPQFCDNTGFTTYAQAQIYPRPQIPTPPDTPPTPLDSQFTAPSYPQYHSHTIPRSQLSPPLDPVSIDAFRELEQKSREEEEVRERDEVRDRVLKDVQKAFGGEAMFTRFLATGSRSARVLRWEVERLGMGG